ncbi:DinB family protein [Flagellimonas aequoris]|uniref:Damage-inducible protein DinB n=1 Tax=Flagellimonas aequoris TaxID=2306997 RepID=A0A418NBM3_9FLAO|nr:DinB family protein [Allomuricauda aequoris]RIV73314.1 damage-inducible protein DinB [Allomuricauda aequoris]TXK07127.1 damage-inducible protein DinB [Allomuricauda aequoris]
MKGFLHQLFDYNFYCNKKIIQQCSALENVPENCERLFSHILNAHHIWNHRLLGIPNTYGVWEMHAIDKWEDIHYENQRASFEIISNTDNFEKRVGYENSEGRSFANETKDILFHIINHSTHHRGQIMMELRNAGVVPEPLDYVHYKR